MHVFYLKKKLTYWHDSLKSVKNELSPTLGCLSLKPISPNVQNYSLRF